MKIDIEKEIRDGLDELVNRVAGEHRMQAQHLASEIAYFTSVGLTTGQIERNERNIAFCLSSLASLASISATEARETVRQVVVEVLTKVSAALIAAA